jgi:glucose/arabinose dehydrogenase
MRLLSTSFLAALLLAGCSSGGGETVAAGNNAAGASTAAANGPPFVVQPVAKFNEPWAMAFLPDGHFLVTERKGQLRLERPRGIEANGNIILVEGVPKVDYGGQGGLGDVILHPDFRKNGLVYLSWAEAGSGDTRGAAVGRGRLVYDGSSARLENFQTIWRQAPKVEGRGHFGHRLVFSPDGHLFITNGDRQKFTPAQDMGQTLGKIVRLRDDGTPAPGNPWANQGGVAAQFWSIGHRNPLGIAFAPDGRLWINEMGPAGGDEFNLIERGSNYGYPIVSNGQHYDGKDIPNHSTRPEFNAPEITWTPVISPSSMIFYTGRLFPQWRGSALIGGLSSKAIIRVTINGNTAREAERFHMGQRIREVEQGPDGSIYVLEDERGGSGGRLLRLTPAR